MNRLLPTVLALVMTLPLTAETLTYRETTQGKTTSETATRTQVEERGLSWQVISSKAGTSRMGKNSAGNLVAAEVSDKDGTWSLKVETDVLKASGTYKDKPVTGSLSVKGRIWSVGFDQPLQWAVTQHLTEPLTFLMINPSEVSKSIEMVLTPEGRDTVGGKPALKYKLGLAGAMALFWSATIWADPVTGDQVQYKGTKGPGTPESLLIIDRQP